MASEQVNGPFESNYNAAGQEQGEKNRPPGTSLREAVRPWPRASSVDLEQGATSSHDEVIPASSNWRSPCSVSRLLSNGSRAASPTLSPRNSFANSPTRSVTAGA